MLTASLFSDSPTIDGVSEMVMTLEVIDATDTASPVESNRPYPSAM